MIRSGHPWLYADSIREQNREAEPGELAVIYDRKNKFLAVGLFDRDSPLRVRVLHAGKPVSHTTLLRQVWGDYAVGDSYNTRYVVAQIRKKLADDPANPRYIVNEPGVGYRLEA